MPNIFDKNIIISNSYKNPNKPSYQECLEYFRSYLSYFDFFTTTDLINIYNYWEYFSIKKGDSIYQPGTVSDYLKFIVVGAVKYYREDLNGKHNVAFLTESNFCTPIKSFRYQLKSDDGVTCIEDTYGIKISFLNYKRLIEEIPAFDHFFKFLTEEIVEYLENRIIEFQSFDAQERYQHLLKNNPDFFNRFSLQDISNYLGIKPETLSRLRNKRS